jgi:putative zinc finger/helix-turn-helix YgiT family protein
MPNWFKAGTGYEAQNAICPNCESREVRTSMEQEKFIYGVDDTAVELTALVPVHTCTACEFQFTDAAGEVARHQAVCRHLGVLTPQEILNLRKRYEMTRAEFATVTRFGEASLARWESGELIQNAANDQLLFLLSVPANMEMLAARSRRITVEQQLVVAPSTARFTALSNIRFHIMQAANFRLCYAPLTS